MSAKVFPYGVGRSRSWGWHCKRCGYGAHHIDDKELAELDANEHNEQHHQEEQ